MEIFVVLFENFFRVAMILHTKLINFSASEIFSQLSLKRFDSLEIRRHQVDL